MSAKAKREGPVRVPLAFDEAIRRVLQVKPPPEGWAAYEKAPKTKRAKKRRKARSAA